MATEITIDTIKIKMASLSKILEEAKTNKATLTGRLQESMKRLNDDLGMSSVEEAQKEIQSIEAECLKLNQSIQEKFQELQGAYEW
jgi:hypothetical protein